ncbi:pathogenicity locus probable regulatory protein wtsA [Vibrio coralliilyticus ATCC BAA-450]|nr:pathogenicity locus probable regulatory protein wtsA [Vibrio coralliilyticus ATCC BAA-450]
MLGEDRPMIGIPINSNHDSAEPNLDKLSIGPNFESERAVNYLSKLPIDIVLEGETGTGKDTLAMLIHRKSGRSGRFVAIHCAALPETIAESELFGVNAGAFTGARVSRSGLIESSHNGTLYLDEIDSMPLSLQVKLLRVLEQRAVVRLGSTVEKTLNLRVITSTKTPLSQLVGQGTFRQDLFYRLSTVELHVTPLREHRSCILPMFSKFMTQFSQKISSDVPEISGALRCQLLHYSWPGNVRELRFCAERIVIGLPIFTQRRKQGLRTLKQQMIEHEKNIIQESVDFNQGEIDIVARDLGLPKRTLYYKISKLNISPKQCSQK